MAYNTEIKFLPAPHTHSEYSKTDHTHSDYAVAGHTHNYIANNSAGSHGIGLKWTGDLVATVDVTDMALAMKNHTHNGGAINGVAISDKSQYDGKVRQCFAGGDGDFVTPYRDITGVDNEIACGWGSGVSFGVGDTHGFLGCAFGSVSAIIAGGSGEKVNWHGHVAIIERIYPVGSIYISTLATNPGSILQVGTWEIVADGRMLMGCSSGATGTGGSNSLTIDSSNIPSLVGTATAVNIEGRVWNFMAYSGNGTSQCELSDEKKHVPGSTKTALINDGGDGKIATVKSSYVEWNTANDGLYLNASHGHTVTIGNSYPKAMNITNAYYKVYVWRRVY